MEKDHLTWFHRPPKYVNRAVAPGNRHLSRIYTKPKAAVRLPDFYPEGQLKIARNYYGAHPQLLMTLIGVKEVFNKQLPNMGSSYITRLVFDFQAESVIILHKGIPTAAISSRLFPEQGFIEIVFLAVDMSYQLCGYGRLIMNFQKNVNLARGMTDILTCADNDAVGYFKKQGFNSKDIRMNPDRWVGYIKDYDGVTLVHCRLHPEIDYINYQDHVLSVQMRELEKRTGFRVSKPIPEFAKETPTLPDGVVHQSLPLPVIFNRCIPKVTSNGVTRLLTNYNEHMETIRNKLRKILKALKADRYNSEIFLRPVTEEIAPDYFETIASPMDLFSIENRLNKFYDYYKRPEIFATDMTLMCQNAKKYNGPESPFYTNAVDIFRKFKRLYHEEFPNAILPST
ncbi:acetyltransferase, GNAT family protein [Histomonas meleagridis]|uniref:acetyltransferase, GNAT family protein n=1 Tax=Histomonas meleagridis TaxID=135588 RepID=UPI003559E204|nr:acetyltransferase, GNAT family protein [Histomonas meleagridis]KAH0801656.1 acetyltransferase, GNAT family protein [Histomonas meleagridis]